MSRHALCQIRDPLICFGKFFPGKEIFIVSLLIRIFLSPCFCFYLLNSNFSENQQINSDSISHTRRFHPIIKPSKLYFCTIQRFSIQNIVKWFDSYLYHNQLFQEIISSLIDTKLSHRPIPILWFDEIDRIGKFINVEMCNKSFNVYLDRK